MTKILSGPLWDAIHSAHDAGKTIRQMMDELKISSVTIDKYLTMAERPGNNRPWASRIQQEARRLFDQGLTRDEIAKKLDLPYSTVRYHLTNYETVDETREPPLPRGVRGPGGVWRWPKREERDWATTSSATSPTPSAATTNSPPPAS